jgi:hypothetical protein
MFGYVTPNDGKHPQAYNNCRPISRQIHMTIVDAVMNITQLVFGHTVGVLICLTNVALSLFYIALYIIHHYKHRIILFLHMQLY